MMISTPLLKACSIIFRKTKRPCDFIHSKSNILSNLSLEFLSKYRYFLLSLNTFNLIFVFNAVYIHLSLKFQKSCKKIYKISQTITQPLIYNLTQILSLLCMKTLL